MSTKVVKKERNYVYDAVRGFLMFVIVIKHLLCANGQCAYGTPEGTFAVILETMSLQLFFILSGLFSKKPERARQTSVGALLWPFVLGIFLFEFIDFLITGEWNFYPLGDQPFGLWFLAVLFAFRFFEIYLVKIPHIFGISIALLFLSGLSDFLSTDFYAFSRMITYLWSFLLGYYMTTEHVEKIRKLKIWWVILLGIVLIAISYYINMEYGALYDKVFQIKASYESLGVTWYEGMILRGIGAVLSLGWFVVLVNVFSNKKRFMAWLGAATMPIYIFHLIVRDLMLSYGPTFGLFEIDPENVVGLWAWIILVSVAICAFSACIVGRKLYDGIFKYTYDGLVFFLKNIFCKIFIPLEKPFEWAGRMLLKDKESAKK